MNDGESLVFPPSPNPAETPNIPSSKEPTEELEAEPAMVETARSSVNSENEPNPTMEFPFSSTYDDNSEYPKPIIMIVPAGEDIVSTILNYACDQDVSIMVHHASGPISEVHISNPLSPSNDSTFQGNMHMFFLSGVYTKCLSPSPPKNVPFSFFNIQFFREHVPQVYGGLVGNKLIAEQPVPVTATVFKEHDYYEYNGRVSRITAPNVQPSIVSNDPNATTTDDNNTVHQTGFLTGDSISSAMDPSSPIDFSNLYENNPTNPGDDY
ncbi:hypothetical protein VIGAN_03047400 [Vigna angularis var. angularis]|nr:hypothetical protein VIGAN_03047400 [Vigna angularis var. angularis]